MAISYPYTIEYLADTLCIVDVVWDVQRNDELSGTGDGRVWQAELAPPLWTASVTLAPGYHEDNKRVAAKIRKLNGSQESFFLYDPTSTYPAYDPTGVILGTSTVTISTISVDRKSMSIEGLPGNYKLSIGDKLQVVYGSPTVRNAFLEISEDITADVNGFTAQFEVFPNIPTGITVGTEIVLAKPACKMIISPGSFDPGSNVYRINSGITFKAIQKK